MSARTRAVILMGVSGCGKTSVGQHLSQELGWPFLDADDFHPQRNREKMGAGVPLDDEDRAPWLETLHDLIHTQLADGHSVIVACSALKRTYREKLAGGDPRVVFVHLWGDYETILQRLRSRPNHYMKGSMLRSQFDALDDALDATCVDVDKSVPEIVSEIIELLSLQSGPGDADRAN